MLGETKLIYGGFIYVRSKLPINGKTYWECKKLRRKKCRSRIITGFDISENKNYFVREPTLDNHNHGPNQEECELEIFKYYLKRKAKDQPQIPPAQILRTEMAGLSDGVLTQLSNPDNLKKSKRQVQRYLFFPHLHVSILILSILHTRKNLLSNPKTLSDLGTLPNQYQKTNTSENFLIYNSFDDDFVNEGKVVVFANEEI